MNRCMLFFRNKMVEIGNLLFDILSFRWLDKTVLVWFVVLLLVSYILGFLYPLIPFVFSTDIQHAMSCGSISEMVVAQIIVGIFILTMLALFIAVIMLISKWISNNIKLANSGIEVKSKWMK